ncbi:hypothetical protein BIT28_24895 [Photobacterium proteolyticum]|uniref:NADH-quinone oxidoreductase subunit I n=1 Tax=Photobacterium proteolyticum TaxID=1903952 RepID=A0A1Q9GD17_9GAMM|nr:4Fe-4S dicluster domain-containing protein [Photobacterium proteolyticum]OLQ72256.1 hypothetical protein BIT28_24895 [Photobacterium proteolyticum]
MNIKRWFSWTLLTDIRDGMRLTLRYMLSKGVTMQYPDKEKWVPYPRHRGHPYLRKDKQGEIKCVGCELCANICPSECITVIPYEDSQGKRRPKIFELDSRRCMYCGLCEDVCPEEAIALGSHLEYSTLDSNDMVLNKEQLLNLPGKNKEGGMIVPATLKAGAQVVAVPSDSEIEPKEQEAKDQELNTQEPKKQGPETRGPKNQGKDWWQAIHRH